MFIVIIGTLMIPVSVILVPAYLVIIKIGWVNGSWGVIIPGAATPSGVFLLRQYMLTIPNELIDAATDHRDVLVPAALHHHGRSEHRRQGLS